MRWTVDTEQDLLFVRSVMARLAGGGVGRTMTEVLELLAREPGLQELNADVTQKKV